MYESDGPIPTIWDKVAVPFSVNKICRKTNTAIVSVQCSANICHGFSFTCGDRGLEYNCGVDFNMGCSLIETSLKFVTLPSSVVTCYDTNGMYNIQLK